MPPRIFTSLAAIAIATAPTALGAQSPDSLLRANQTLARSFITVSAASSPITLDGRLDDAAWAAADSITDFRQREPSEGFPATERTTVKIVRDGAYIYVGARMYDRNPSALVVTQLRRDSDLGSDDSFGFVIDSFHDQRGGFAFQTNPNGAMWDAQITGAEDKNENWNGIWDVAVTRDSLGWATEFRIPLRTLRFNAGAGAAFGFNARRVIRRKNEEDLWVSWRRSQGVFHFENEGELVGLGVLARARNLELKPYALARLDVPSYAVGGALNRDASRSAKFGADAKLAVTPTLTADLTLNTDFAQVEADRQIVNLSRFPLFFPEKREFFLESSSIFSFGTSGRAQPFYSRRIGLDRSGRPVPILGGARLTGKAGHWAIGLLDTRTGAHDAANDAVIRVKRDLLDRSYIGAILVNRSGPGVAGSQSAAGVDIDLPLVIRGKYVEPSFWLSGTHNSTKRGTPVAWRLAVDYPNDLFDNFAALYRIGAGYDPALGFVRRAGILETSGHIDFRPRPKRYGIRRFLFRPVPEWDIIADDSGSLTDSRTWQTARLEWRPLGGTTQAGDNFEVNIQRQMERPASAFEIFRGVNVNAGSYWWTRYELQYESSSGRPLSLRPEISWGDFYDGRGTAIQLGATYRGGGHVVIGADFSQQNVRLSGGSFRAVSGGTRVEYSFSTRSDFLVFAQYNNDSRRADFNLRYHWTPVIGDDFFVVWNSGYSTDPMARYRFGQASAIGKPLNGALVIKGVHRLAF